MKIISLIFTAVLLLLFVSCQNTDTYGELGNLKVKPVNKPEVGIDQFSYIVGFNMGTNFKRDSLYNVNMDYFIAGMKHAIEGTTPLLNQLEQDSIMAIFQNQLQKKQRNVIEQRNRDYEANKQEAFKFLEENKKDPSVVTLPSGIEYKVLQAGSGSGPMMGDYLKMHVKTMLLNGDIIDDSFKRSIPIYQQFDDQIFKSWQEVLPLMKKGSRWIIWSPPELAFGSGLENKIPPGKLAIFTIELLDFQLEEYPEASKMKPPALQ